MKNKRLIVLSAIIAVAALLAIGTVVTATSSTVVVTPTNLNGWTQQHSICSNNSPTGSQAFVDGPGTPPLGTGSHEFRIGLDGDSFETMRNPNYSGVKLTSLTALGYSTYVQQFIDGQAPYILLNIDLNGDGVFDVETGPDDQIFFEPVYQSAVFFPSNNQGVITLNTWQDWDALHGGWWSLKGTNGANPGTGVKSLSDYGAGFPNAAIINSSTGAGGFRVATGCGGGAWTNFVGNADAVIIGVNGNTTTYDFELHTVPTSVNQCKNGGWKTFNPPPSHGPFKNQGDCIQFVNTGK
jgi:hypothetical protein